MHWTKLISISCMLKLILFAIATRSVQNPFNVIYSISPIWTEGVTYIRIIITIKLFMVNCTTLLFLHLSIPTFNWNLWLQSIGNISFCCYKCRTRHHVQSEYTLYCYDSWILGSNSGKLVLQQHTKYSSGIKSFIIIIFQEMFHFRYGNVSCYFFFFLFIETGCPISFLTLLPFTREIGT